MSEKTKRTIDDYTIWEEAKVMLNKAKAEGIETVWDRFEEQQPVCKFCEQGTSCKNCSMGPCRVQENSVSGKRKLGICGASADVIVARNFGRFVAGGAAGHSDHGRDLIEVLDIVADKAVKDYSIKDEGKLRRIAKELGIEEEKLDLHSVAKDLAELLFTDFGTRRKGVNFLSRVPKKRQEIWEKLGITPRGVDREIAEMMHRTHMGVDNDATNILLHAMRCALADGWAGSMIGTELSDILFGTPTPKASKASLAVIKEDCVNILVHGHNPVVSEVILAAAKDPELLAQAKKNGASGGINVAGLCCTGNELLMRQGIPLAGNHLMTELALITGAVESIVVDYQCIMPSLVNVAACYHTRFIDTSAKARFTGADHYNIEPHNALSQAKEIVKKAVEDFTKRDKNRVQIPGEAVDIMVGFSNEAILNALGGTLTPLLDAVKAGSIRGFGAVVGCNNPKIQHDSMNVEMMKELIKKDVLVLVTGCITSAAGKAGLLVPEGAEMAGEGLKAVCKSLGIPPVLHMGSCVDNSRIMHLVGLIANELNVDIADLPVVASAPEWYSEKAATIGLYAVASGIYTHLGHPPQILGSSNVTKLALEGLEDVVGATFAVEGDMKKAAEAMDKRISAKRKALGLSN